MTHPSHPVRVEALCPVPLGPMPTTGTLSPWALRPLGDPVVVCQVRSTFRVSVHPLPPAHCRVCPAGRSRRRSAHPRETGIRVFSVIPDGGRSHPLGLEFKQSSLTPAWPNARTPLDPVTLGLTSLYPHAIVPPILSDEGQRIVLPAFFQRGQDSPDKTRQTFATAHRFGPTTPTRPPELPLAVRRLDRP